MFLQLVVSLLDNSSSPTDYSVVVHVCVEKGAESGVQMCVEVLASRLHPATARATVMITSVTVR